MPTWTTDPIRARSADPSQAALGPSIIPPQGVYKPLKNQAVDSLTIRWWQAQGFLQHHQLFLQALGEGKRRI